MKCLAAILGAVGMIGCVAENLSAQIITIHDGKWSSPSTWSGGVIPDFTQGTIIINHAVTIPEDTLFVVDELEINSTLTIEQNAHVTIAYSGKSAGGDLRVLTGSLLVFGTLICKDQVITETNNMNTFFYDGSTYEHQHFSIAGEPPRATWQTNSTLVITGFTSSKSLSNAGWQQYFGNVTYNCPGQLTFIDMLGNLKNIAGDLRISNTNGNILRLSLDKKTLSVIEVGGDFIIEGDSEVWICREGNTQLNVAGNMELRSTSTSATYITTQGNGELNVAGNVLLSSLGNLRFASNGGGTGIFRIAGNVIMNSGQLTAASPGIGILEFNGNTKQTVTLFNDLPEVITIINNNVSETELITNDELLGSIQCNAGHLILPEHFSLYGDLIVSEEATVQYPETLPVVGMANQQLDVNGGTLVNLKMNKQPGTTVTLTSAMNLIGYLHIESVNTDLISNGNLTLLSQDDDGLNDASIYILPDDSDVIGDVHVQRYMKGEGRIYRYISIPVTNATIADLQDDFEITGSFTDPSTGPGINKSAPSFFYYNEMLTGEQGWTPYPTNGLAMDAGLLPGVGYAAFIRRATSATVWDVTGTINQGEMSLPVQHHNYNDATNDGWNLIGNPYPATIDWDAENGWEKSNLETGIYIRENGTGQFLFWDGDIGNLGNGRIAKGQSFWVKTNADDPVLIIKETAKVMNNAAFYRNEKAVIDFVEVTLTSGAHQDKTYLRLRAEASRAYDSTDVIKMKNDHVNICFLQQDISVAIASVHEVDCHEPLQLIMTYAKDKLIPPGSYHIQFQTHGVFSLHTLKLVDGYTGETVNVTGAGYTFSVTDEAATSKSDRFSLIVNSIELPADFSIEPAKVFCPESAYVINLHQLPENWKVTLTMNHQDVVTHSRSSHHQQIEVHIPDISNENMAWNMQLGNACSRFHFSGIAPRMKPPIITAKNGFLYSLAEGNVEWLFENESIPGANQSHYVPVKEGRYALKVSLNQCEAISYYDYLFQEEVPLINPNPVAETVNCTAPLDDSIVSYELMDLSGKLIVRNDLFTPARQVQVNMLSQPSGLYLLKIYTTKKQFAMKVVKN